MPDFSQLIGVSKRKITSHGEGAPLVRMDAKWLEENSLKAGDSVELCRLPGCRYLIVVPSKKKARKK